MYEASASQAYHVIVSSRSTYLEDMTISMKFKKSKKS